MQPHRSLIILSTLAVFGCSSGSNENPVSNTDPLTGVFIDSPVSGLSYTTDTLTGVTDADGRFQYIAGETIVFSIGSLSFPSVPASAQLTPVSLAAGSNDPSATSTNIARLLQSLDTDGNPDNGIIISSDIASTAAVDFDVTLADFESNADVINLVANSGSTTTALVSAEDADAHLNLSLATTNTTADIMSFTTGAQLQAAGGAALTGAQLESKFRGKKFISLDGSFDWEFFENGSADSFGLDGIEEDFIGLPWSIENGKLCRTRGDQYPCVTVFALGDKFRLSLDGRDGSDGLESWAIEYASFDLRTVLLTGADDSSTALWNCVFDNIDDTTADQAMNTITFWENGRGVNGSGRLYDWAITNEDRVDGTYDGGDRLLVLEGFKFTNNFTNFTALNISTVNVGTPDETVRNFRANCNRVGDL